MQIVSRGNAKAYFQGKYYDIFSSAELAQGVVKVNP